MRAIDLFAALDEGLDIDLVLLDVMLGDDNPTAAVVAETLAERGVRSLLVTMKHGGPLTRKALVAGAADVVPKDAPEGELLDAIRRAANGETLWSRRAVAILGETIGPRLSDRETQVVRMYVQGLLMSTIARRMGVTENTANTYLKRVRTKFRQLGKQADTREELRNLAADGESSSAGSRKRGDPQAGRPPDRRRGPVRLLIRVVRPARMPR